MNTRLSLGIALSCGVGYAAFLKYGLGWGLLYGLVAEEWLAYRLAAWLLQ